MRRRGRPPYPGILTPREQEVVELLREGLTNPEIGQRLGISLDGAKYHVSEITGKLGVSDRYEAATWQPTPVPWWRTAIPSFVPWPFGSLLWSSAAKVAAATAASVVVTIIGLAIAAIGSLGTLAGLIWLSATRSGDGSQRPYDPRNVRRAVIATAVASALAVLGYMISDPRHIPYLFGVLLAGATLATASVCLGLSIVARVRNGGSVISAVIKGAAAALVITSFIWLGVFDDEGDILAWMILFGFGLLVIATAGGVLWLPVALVRRRGRTAAAGFVWFAAALAVVGGIAFGIFFRFGARPTIEGLELLSVTLNKRGQEPVAGVQVHGSYAYVGGQSTSYYKPRNKTGVRILDISDPATPTLVGRIPLRSFEKFSKSVGDSPPHSHGDAVATRINSAAFQGDIAIVLNGVPDTFNADDYPLPFGIWDVTDPTDPQFLSALNLGNSYSYDWEGDKPNDDKAVNGQYFYAVYNTGQGTNDHDSQRNEDHHLAIVDLSDPRNPVVVGSWQDKPVRLRGLSLNAAGTRAYVVGTTLRPDVETVLYVLDIQDPRAPVEIGRYTHPFHGLPYAVPNEDDSLVVFADGSGPCRGKAALRILDVSDPNSIHEVSVFELPGSNRCYLWGRGNVGEATDMVVKGNLVYSTWMEGGLRVIDISDPANPVEVGKFVSSPEKPWLSDVALYGDVVLAATIWDPAGVYLLR